MGERPYLNEDEGRMLEEEYMTIIGEIVSIKREKEKVIVELKNELEEGYGVIFLTVDAESIVTDPLTDERLQWWEMEEKMRVRGFFGPMIIAIEPPESHAAKIEILNDKLVRTGVITEISPHVAHQYILVGTMEDGVRLFIDEKTMIVNSLNEEEAFETFVEGMTVEVFYGPIQTMSMPPMSTALKIVIRGHG